ncbi:MAG: hypothetical protein M4579_002688 [Chaenotheca gracillima]|nr:MAG: hypothetical protein M4579_002688 [Chaenotheca gracillima]
MPCRTLAQHHRPQHCPPRVSETLLRPGLRTRQAFNVRGHRQVNTRVQEAGQYLKDRPMFTALGVVTFLTLFGGMYGLYQYNKIFVVGQFQAFPDPVAKKLRRALYYSNYSPSPKDAVKNYREALALADQIGMDPYSDEIIGVKAHFAGYLEKIGQVHQSVALLQLTRDDCQRYINDNRDNEENKTKSRKLLKKVIGMTVKIGELYGHPYLQSPEMAEKNLSAAVSAVLQAKARQESEGEEKEEGTWVTDEEAGATLEAAAEHYIQMDRYDLSAPLYLRAIELCPKSDCNIVYLMNGLAVSLSGGTPQTSTGAPQADRAALFDAGRLWANKALEVAGEIKPPERNEKCDTGCATVIQNLGQMAETQGDLTEARRRYDEARSLSKAISYDIGVEVATEALARLEGNKS